jgi:hypothetical protein
VRRASASPVGRTRRAFRLLLAPVPVRLSHQRICVPHAVAHTALGRYISCCYLRLAAVSASSIRFQAERVVPSACLAPVHVRPISASAAPCCRPQLGR